MTTPTQSESLAAQPNSQSVANGDIAVPNATPRRWAQELMALAVSIVVILVVLPIIGLAWWTMWTAQVRLTPNPQAELLAELEARGVQAGPPLDPEFYAYGKKVYFGTCITCHGADGRGVAGNGKDLVRSSFIAQRSDDELVQFLLKGRDLSDPLNTTKILMPPKGGNPVLNEDDLYDVVEFLRGLQDPRRIPTGPFPPQSASKDVAGLTADLNNTNA
jgi:mono/diheme cytochrome c family protein